MCTGNLDSGGSGTGGNALIIHIDIVRIGSTVHQNAYIFHVAQVHLIDLLTRFKGNLLAGIAAGNGDTGRCCCHTHSITCGSGSHKVSNLGGLFIGRACHQVRSSDHLHIMEGFSGHIHGITCGIHRPFKIKSAACIAVIGICQIGVGSTIGKQIHIAKPAALRECVEVIRTGDGAVHTGQQNAGQGKGTLLRQVVHGVNIRARPCKGSAMGGCHGVAIIILPVRAAGFGLGIGDGVVPDRGRLIMLRACQGIPGTAILGNPYLARFHRAQTCTGGNILEGIAINIEVHTVSITRIIGQTVFHIEGHIAAKVTQRQQAAGQCLLGIYTITTGITVDILAVDGQEIHHLVGDIDGFPLAVSEGISLVGHTITGRHEDFLCQRC